MTTRGPATTTRRPAVARGCHAGLDPASTVFHTRRRTAGLPVHGKYGALKSSRSQNAVPTFWSRSNWSTRSRGITDEAGPSWRYRPHAALDGAADLATRRYFQDGAWVIGRRASVGSVSALEACALSAWGVDHLPPEVGMQLF